MSIAKCLGNAVAAGEISKAEAADLNELYESARRRRSGSPTAEAEAKGELAALLKAAAAEKKRRAKIAALVQKRVVSDLAKFRTATGKEDIAEGALALIEHYGGSTTSSVEGRRKTIIGLAHAKMEDLLDTFLRTKLAGVTPNLARLENVVREAFGQETGDIAAKALAQSWSTTADGLRQRFNRAGGAIARLDKWGLPQNHDPRALLAAGKPQWKAAIRPLLDISRMRHPATDTPILEEELDGLLEDVWSNIATDGWKSREPGRRPFGTGALATQRADHRFLVFKDADAWLSYAKDFSQGDAFATMMSHVNVMARDIAALEILGPNPNATVEWLKQSITRAGALAHAGEAAPIAPGLLRSTKSRAAAKSATLDAMWQEARGARESSTNETLTNFMAGSRNWVTASVLGSAIVSAVPTDPVYGAIARHMAGIPVTKELHSMMTGLAGMSRREAVRAGLILDSAMHVFGTNARYVGTLSGPGWTRWLSDRVLTASGLSPWTQAGRHAFGLDFMGTLAEHAKDRFPDLPPGLQRTLSRWGLGHPQWEIMRSAALHDPQGNGATFLRPHEIAAVNHPEAHRIAEKYLEMVLAETEYAVPSTTLRGRVALRTAKPGTLWREGVQESFSMFKAFPMTYGFLWGARMWRETVASPARGAAYAGALLTMTGLGGMLAMWLKDIVNGRDPRPVSVKMAGAALLQGGGIGIWGDFLFSDLNRYGGGIATQLAGPLGERGTGLLNLTAGNAMQLVQGEDTNFLKELKRFAEGNVPGGNLWYLKLGYERVLLDQLDYMIDAKANRGFKSRETYWRKNFGNAYWWRPGTTRPDRGPDLGAVAP